MYAKRAESRRLRWCGVLLLVACYFYGPDRACASSLVLASPASGATVSGKVSIITRVDSSVTWVDVDIDSKFFAASPPFTFSWDSTRVGNGPHKITALAFNKSGGQVGSVSMSVNVSNSAVSAGGGHSYYVAAGGKDSNAGTSASAPWLTVQRVNAANLRPGDTVYFKAGNLWRGTLEPPRGGVSGAPITFASFGSGNPPVISGADTVKSWSLDSGYIYQAPLAKRPGNTYVDGGPGWGLRAAASVYSMTRGSWYWDSGHARLCVAA